MILKGKVFEASRFYAEIYLSDGGKIKLPIGGLCQNQHVEIEVRPILTNSAAAGGQLPLPFVR